MSLSASLIKKFVEATNDSGKDEVSKVVYGTVDIVDGTKVVVVDGSSSPTSITEGVEVFYGDRVLVTIENNSAVVTSNITHPATNTGTELNDEVSSGGETMTRLEWFNQGVLKADTVEADYGNFKKVYAETLAADEAKIGKLETDTIKADDISAETGKYNYLSSDKLDAKYATVSKLEADEAEISTLKTDTIKTTDISAETGKYNYLSSDKLDAKYATVSKLEADEADISTLKTDTIKTTDISAETGKYNYLSSDKLDAKYATVSKLEADEAEISTLKTDTIKTTDISAETGTYHYLSAGKLDATYADISLINVADGAISDAKIASLSANKLTAGTIDASKITVTNLNADNLTVGTINGKLIGSGTVDLASLSEEVPTKEYLDSVEDKLQDEIDGAIETFTSDTIPTLNNYPASDWTDDDTKAKHVGDICYVINESDTANGWCYRFAKSSNGTYSWVLIKDSDVTAALKRLKDAEDNITGLIDFKSTTTSWIENTDEELSSLKEEDTKITDALGNKVEVKSFNTLSQTVGENTSNITSLKETVDGQTTTLSQHTTEIKQNAYNIELKVSSADFNGNEMISRINLDETTVKIAADKLEVNGNLVVEDESENILFEANVDNHLVTIGGWNVNDSAIYHGTDSATSTEKGLYLGTSHIRGYTDEDHYFDLANGTLTCSGMEAKGVVVAESGKIGNFSICGYLDTLKYSYTKPNWLETVSGGIVLWTSVGSSDSNYLKYSEVNNTYTLVGTVKIATSGMNLYKKDVDNVFDLYFIWSEGVPIITLSGTKQDGTEFSVTCPSEIPYPDVINYGIDNCVLNITAWGGVQFSVPDAQGTIAIGDIASIESLTITSNTSNGNTILVSKRDEPATYSTIYGSAFDAISYNAIDCASKIDSDKNFLYMGSDAFSLMYGDAKMFVDDNGLTISGDSTFSGSLNVFSGNIGGWIIGNDEYSSTEKAVEDYEAYKLETIDLKVGTIEQWNAATEKEYEKVHSIYYGTFGEENSFYLIPDTSGSKKTSQAAIGGREITEDDFCRDWSLTIGKNFGVTYKGAMYANDVNIAGSISATNLEVLQTIARESDEGYSVDDTFELNFGDQGLLIQVETGDDIPVSNAIILDKDGTSITSSNSLSLSSGNSETAGDLCDIHLGDANIDLTTDLGAITLIGANIYVGDNSSNLIDILANTGADEYFQLPNGMKVFFTSVSCTTGTTANNGYYSGTWSVTVPITFTKLFTFCTPISGNVARHVFCRPNGVGATSGILLSDTKSYTTSVQVLIIGY